MIKLGVNGVCEPAPAGYDSRPEATEDALASMAPNLREYENALPERQRPHCP